MAWGTTGITEDELKRIAAVREYLYEQFPSASIRDSYDSGRLAQVFRVETGEPVGVYTAVVSTEFLTDHPASQSRNVLVNWDLADHLRAAKGSEVLVRSGGVDMRKAGR